MPLSECKISVKTACIRLDTSIEQTNRHGETVTSRQWRIHGRGDRGNRLPSDLTTAIFFLLVLQQYQQKLSKLETGDIAETSHYCRRLAPGPSPQWIGLHRFQPDSVFQRSITLYKTCMYCAKLNTRSTIK